MQILELELGTTPTNFDSFEAEFKVHLSSRTPINSIVGWFEVQMTGDAWFSTSPFEAPTHWGQTVFPIIETEVLDEGASLSGKI